MRKHNRHKVIRSLIFWTALVVVPALGISWFNQSRYNNNIELLFAAASQQQLMQAPIRDFSGETFSLADLPKKPVLLDFWASWCPSCRVSMPELAAMQAQYGEKLLILAVNIMEPPRDGLSYAADTAYKLRFVHSNRLATLFEVKVLPTKVLLDVDRKVIWAGTGHIPFLTQKWLESHL